MLLSVSPINQSMFRVLLLIFNAPIQTVLKIVTASVLTVTQDTSLIAPRDFVPNAPILTDPKTVMVLVEIVLIAMN